jgi:hypothetical protein
MRQAQSVPSQHSGLLASYKCSFSVHPHFVSVGFGSGSFFVLDPDGLSHDAIIAPANGIVTAKPAPINLFFKFFIFVIIYPLVIC